MALAGVILDLHCYKIGYLPLLHYVIGYDGLNPVKRLLNPERMSSLLKSKLSTNVSALLDIGFSS